MAFIGFELTTHNNKANALSPSLSLSLSLSLFARKQTAMAFASAPSAPVVSSIASNHPQNIEQFRVMITAPSTTCKLCRSPLITHTNSLNYHRKRSSRPYSRISSCAATIVSSALPLSHDSSDSESPIEKRKHFSLLFLFLLCMLRDHI
mgnify:FL=1